jgi:hypothetical protein
MAAHSERMLDASCRVATQAQQVLGTPTNIVFSFRNRSPHPITFSIGNGLSDSYRFLSSHDVTVLDPYYEFGGIRAIRQLKPGQEMTDDVLLNEYLYFSHPGQYVVSCDLDVDVTDARTGVVQAHSFRGQIDLKLMENPDIKRATIGALAADLDSQDSQRQLRSSGILAELRDRSVVPIMVRKLHLKNDAVVENLLLGLGRIDSEEARSALSDFSTWTTSPDLRKLAEQQLARPSR